MIRMTGRARFLSRAGEGWQPADILGKICVRQAPGMERGDGHDDRRLSGITNEVVPGLALAASGRQSRAGRALSRAGQVRLVEVLSTASIPHSRRRGCLMPPRQTRAGCDMRGAALNYCLGQATVTRPPHHCTASPSYVSASALAHAREFGATPRVAAGDGGDRSERQRRKSVAAGHTNNERCPPIRQGLEQLGGVGRGKVTTHQGWRCSTCLTTRVPDSAVQTGTESWWPTADLMADCSRSP